MPAMHLKITLRYEYYHMIIVRFQYKTIDSNKKKSKATVQVDPNQKFFPRSSSSREK